MIDPIERFFKVGVHNIYQSFTVKSVLISNKINEVSLKNLAEISSGLLCKCNLIDQSPLKTSILEILNEFRLNEKLSKIKFSELFKVLVLHIFEKCSLNWLTMSEPVIASFSLHDTKEDIDL